MTAAPLPRVPGTGQVAGPFTPLLSREESFRKFSIQLKKNLSDVSLRRGECFLEEPSSGDTCLRTNTPGRTPLLQVRSGQVRSDLSDGSLACIAMAFGATVVSADLRGEVSEEPLGVVRQHPHVAVIVAGGVAILLLLLLLLLLSSSSSGSSSCCGCSRRRGSSSGRSCCRPRTVFLTEMNPPECPED